MKLIKCNRFLIYLYAFCFASAFATNVNAETATHCTKTSMPDDIEFPFEENYFPNKIVVVLGTEYEDIKYSILSEIPPPEKIEDGLITTTQDDYVADDKGYILVKFSGIKDGLGNEYSITFERSEDMTALYELNINNKIIVPATYKCF